jgi:predicted DNA-binding transcriptional regulator YafY
MRADRLLSIMLLLQIHKRLTSHDLAGRLEVSERTIHRDMEALSGAGVPVFAERGAAGGWSLVEDYRTSLTGLKKEEIFALFLSTPAARLLSDLGLEKASAMALTKLRASLPDIHQSTAQYALQRIYIDAEGWNSYEESAASLPVIQEAIWSERKLNIVYRRPDGCESFERIVDPLGLVAKGSVWYMVASVDGEVRSYRVSRIANSTILDEPVRRPEHFDLPAFWRQSTSDFKTRLPRYSARLRVSQVVLPRLKYAGRFARIEKVEAPDPDGWAEVSMRFQFESEACEYALSFGPQVEVIEPISLRDHVVEVAKSVIEFYGHRAGPHAQ